MVKIFLVDRSLTALGTILTQELLRAIFDKMANLRLTIVAQFGLGLPEIGNSGQNRRLRINQSQKMFRLHANVTRRRRHGVEIEWRVDEGLRVWPLKDSLHSECLSINFELRLGSVNYWHLASCP